ncbi:MAG TPA: ankyrin repeat domain-containing protein [Rickettsia endosymbiont of Pyrocoelia pectoralis]|nr:ankyrin repeat domain-containing protein [Rickettsia endosymbiont of Pyrocoelia pectoralis]
MEGIKILLDARADVNGNKDESPLMLASEHGHVAIVEYLLANGAKHDVTGWGKDKLCTDVSFQIQKLSSLLNIAISSSEPEQVFVLLQHGISQTSVSSNYAQYNDLPAEQLPKFLKQLSQDRTNFLRIENLLEKYSNNEVTNTTEDYVSDFKPKINLNEIHPIHCKFHQTILGSEKEDIFIEATTYEDLWDVFDSATILGGNI